MAGPRNLAGRLLGSPNASTDRCTDRSSGRLNWVRTASPPRDGATGRRRPGLPNLTLGQEGEGVVRCGIARIPPGSHPIVCLAILTPGIPSTSRPSSSLLTAVTDPVLSFPSSSRSMSRLIDRRRPPDPRGGPPLGKRLGDGLPAGVGLRGHRGGVGDNTLFNSSHGAGRGPRLIRPVRRVNWVWATSVLAFHAIQLASRGSPSCSFDSPCHRPPAVLSRRWIVLAVISLAGSTSVETLIVFGEFHFWMGTTLLVGCFVTIGNPWSGAPTGSLRGSGVR